MPTRPQFETEKEWLEHLRLWFAGQALAGDLAATPNFRPSIAGSAERAYAYADAMLAERQKP